MKEDKMFIVTLVVCFVAMIIVWIPVINKHREDKESNIEYATVEEVDSIDSDGISNDDATKENGNSSDVSDYVGKRNVFDDSLVDMDNKISIVDGKATYEDEHLKYSWNVGEYYYEIVNDCPALYKYYEGDKYTFAILACEEGIAADLGLYAMSAMDNYYENYRSEHTLAMDTFDLQGTNSYISVCTGYYVVDKDDLYSTNYFSHVYSMTDGRCTVVVAITVTGVVEESIEEIHENSKEAMVLENVMRDIVESFQLKGEV